MYVRPGRSERIAAPQPATAHSIRATRRRSSGRRRAAPLELRGGDRIAREHGVPDGRVGLVPRAVAEGQLRDLALAVHHPDRFSLPCRFAYTSPRLKIARPSGMQAAPISEQRPDVVPHRRERRAVEDRRADPVERVRRGRDLREPLHPLGQDLDRVVDAGHDEQHALRDEPELRALLRRDQRQHRGHHPDPEERDGRHDEHDERRGEVRVRRTAGRRTPPRPRRAGSRGRARRARRRRPSRRGASPARAAP